VTIKLKAGDRIRVKCQGQTITGTVLTAYNWKVIPEDPDDWYIEFTGPNGYAYWKQGVDGGQVEFEGTTSRLLT